MHLLLYYINTDKCTHLLLNHHFTNTVCNSNMFHPLTLQRGVTSTARHRENATCRGVTSAARHAAFSLIRLYLDNKGRKCNRAALYVFRKDLALLWCWRQFLHTIASFFPLLSKFGFSFCGP